MAAPSDLSSYVAGHRARAQESAQAVARHVGELRARLPTAVEILVRDFGVSRVVLFGSLARGEAKPGSDVDLLVESLAPARIFEAAAVCTGILGADVDLVPAEAARAGVVERVLAEGEVLHG